MYPATVEKNLRGEANRILVIGVVSIVIGSSLCIMASARKVIKFIGDIDNDSLI